MARNPDDPYNRATPFGRRVYDSANNGIRYDREWLKREMAKAERTRTGDGSGEDSFAATYRNIFGEDIEYDPIKTTAPDEPRLDLTDDLDLTSSDPIQREPDELDALYNEYLTSQRAAPPEDNAFGEDTLRALGAGTAQTGAMGAGALEYGARRAREGMDTSVFSEMMDDVIGGLSGARRGMSEQAQEWLQGISPESLDRMQRHVLSLDPEQSIWRGGPTETLDSLYMKVTQALPATVLTLLPAARMFRGGMTPGAVTYLGASEGGLSLGGIANGIAEEIEGMTDEELLAESPRYKQLLQEIGDAGQARAALISEAQGYAPLVGGLIIGAISSTAGRYLEPVFQKGAGLATRTGTGIGVEAVQEAPQSGVEQYVQNVAAQVYDQNRGEFDNVAEATAEGALVGGLTGGAFSAAFGGGREDTEVLPESTSEDANVPPSTRADWFTAPPGRVSDTDDFGLEQPPGYVRGGGPSDVQPIRHDPYVVRTNEPFATGIVKYEGVAPEIAAAMEAEGGQQRMYLPEQGEVEAMGAQGGLTPMSQGPRREPVVRPPNALAVQPGTQPLPLRQRGRGGYQQPEGGEFPALQPNEPDMTSPTGRYEDPRQQTMFDQTFAGAPDEPGAEPLVDLEAQLMDMETPGSERLGVYLSAANIEQLRNTRSLEPLLERGVVLANFDGKGGAMIARDREAAQELLDFRNTGAGDIQEVLGYATGAGSGKPAAGVTVQRRRGGAVVQESVVPEDQVDALTQQWETQYPGDEVAILSVPAALRRRQQLLAQEQQKRVKRGLIAEREQDVARTRGKVLKATAITPAADADKTLLGSKATARRVTEGARSPTKAAARLLGQATREMAEPDLLRIGGFYPPDELQFEDATEEVRYRARFRRLAARELDLTVLESKIQEIRDRKFSERRRESYKDRKLRYNEWKKKNNDDARPLLAARANEQAKKDDLLDELAEIRKRAKPTHRAAQLVKAAARLSPKAVEEATKKAEVRATNKPEDDVAEPDHHIEPDDLRKMTDAKIEALEDDKLKSAFKQAVTYLSGRVEDVVEISVGEHVTDEAIESLNNNAVKKYISGFYNPKDPDADKYIPPGKDAPVKRRKVRAMDAYRLMLSSYTRPSEMRKLIRRARDVAMTRPHGGATQSKPITASSTSLKTRPDVHRRKGKFETQVLAAEFAPQDESVSAREKRRAKAQRMRERLGKTMVRAKEHLKVLANSKIARERDGDGLTDRARAMVYGRAYFRTVIDFANAMVKSKNSTEPILEEMAKVDEFLRNGVGMPHADFARVMGNLLHAEAQTQISEAKTDELKELADPEVREEKNAEILEELLAAEASLFRHENIWRQNPYYRSIVEPLIHKFSESRARDGYPSYKPTEDEMVKLAWVMKNWRIPRLRKTFYTPLRHYFTTVGMQWTPTKKVKGEYVGGDLIIPYVESTFKGDKGRRVVGDGKAIRYKYSLSDRALRPLYVAKFGTEPELGTLPEVKLTPGERQTLHDQNVAAGRLPKRQRFTPAPRYTPPSAIPGAVKGGRAISPMERAGRLLQANRVIAKFRDIIAKPKATIAGMIRTEERLIRAFQELGMWTQTGPQTGSVKFQNSTQAYRLVGPRLASKELSKEEGRKILLQQMQPQPVADDVFTTNPRARRLAQEPLRAESEMFLESIADPGPGIAAFRTVALRINQLLDETHRVHTLGEMLPYLVEGLPENHMFHSLAQKLMNTPGVADTPLSWDMRGQLRYTNAQGKTGENLGTTKWEDDPRAPNGRLRYVLLNRTLINSRREPGATLLHVLLHEAMHIATQGAIDRNKSVRDAMTMVKIAAVRFLHNEGGRAWDDMPYGLQELQDVGEFVAEAYSNPNMQSLLKRIPYDYSKSLMTRFIEIVKGIFGVDTQRPEPRNMFEAVMFLENHIFTGQDRLSGGVSTQNVQEYDRVGDLQYEFDALSHEYGLLERVPNPTTDQLARMAEIDRRGSEIERELDRLNDLIYDEYGRERRGSTSMNMGVGTLGDEINTRIRETGETFKRGWARGLMPNAPLIMMTMRQIHKEFRRHFGTGKNAIDRYMENWERRNAENSRLMEQGEKISTEWSAATEKTSTKDALEFSRLVTEASLGGIHPDRAVNAKGNEHLTLPAAKQRHAELHARFNRLPEQWQKLYARVTKYYRDTLQQETNLLMLNALRGTLAAGDNAIMSRTEFDKRYTQETVQQKKLYTEEGLAKEFGTLDKNMLKTLQEIASIPQQREGPYHPLMRYGDYVVYARKPVEKRTFATSKEAYQYRAEKLASDPLLEVGVKKVDDNQYVVYVAEVDFRTRETLTEAEEQRDEMRKLYPGTDPETGKSYVTDVQLKDNFKAEETIQSGSALASILSNLKGNQAAQNAIKNYWLRTLSDRSFRKHQIRRKNREGVDYDQQHRSFTNYVKQASYHISQLQFGWRMADAFRDIREFVRDSRDTPEITSVRLGQVMKELEKRDEMTNNLTELPKAIRTATEMGQLFMLFGPSYWLMNLSQPYMVTMPWLGARYGWAGAGAAMKNAQGLILHPLLKAGKDSVGGAKAFMSKVAAEKAFNVLDQVKETIRSRGGARAAAYIDMLEQLRQQSVIDLSWIAELRDIAEGRSTSGYQRFMDATRVMAHLTEVNNRIVTSLAAYDLRYNEVMAREGATHELAHAAAVQTAKDAVAETQFDYSSGNKPRLFQTGGPLGKMAPLVFQFLQYSQHMYAMLISNFATAVRRGDMDREVAIKTLAGLLGTHAAMAGALGIVLQPIKWAVGLLLMAAGMMDDEEDNWTFANAMSGETFDREARKGLSWALGNELGSVVAQGLPELAGVRLTDRMALGTVYYLDLKTDTAESTLGSVAKGFMGPVLGYSFDAVAASKLAMEGEGLRAAESLAPKAVRDVMRTVRMANDGIVNNAGDQVLDAKELSPLQLFMQAMGFRPSEIADMYAKQAVIKETEQTARARRDNLIARFRKADTIDERNAVLMEAAEFSRRHPAFRITRSSLLRALAGQREREASYDRYGASLRGRSRLYGDEADYYD